MLKSWVFRTCVLAILLLGTATLAVPPRSERAAPPAKSDELQVYFVDVEGGQATLFVAPGGGSLLVDTGWPGNNGRDADRIVAAAKMAGLAKIEYVLLTHYHRDHAGGITQLGERIPIGAVVDHGENRESSDEATEEVWQDYQRFLAKAKTKRIIAKPGDLIPVDGVRVEAITADGAMIAKPLSGAGAPNPACAESESRAADKTENPRSLGTLITFGKFSILDLGDLTWDKEMELMCPVNRVGRVNVFIVNHHGLNQSNSPALVYGVAPRVAIMDNGATKGGSPSTWDIIEKSPGLEDLWQVHYSNEGGNAHNVDPARIANPEGPDEGHYLKLTASKDGSFEVYNSRTRKQKKYLVKR
jgi:competence protein ComEC